MRSFNWIFSFFTIFVLLLGSAQVGLTQTQSPQSPSPTPFPTPFPFLGAYSGQATSIITGNCNSSTTTPPGLCQPAPACNNGAGPNLDQAISASVTLCEYRGILTGSGTGTGFQPGAMYVSLLYKNGSVATCSRFPAGTPPYIQNIPLADNDFASMMLGFWQVNADGTANLKINKQATILGLNNYATVSVRKMQTPYQLCFDCLLDPAPQLNALRACGTLTVTLVNPEQVQFDPCGVFSR